MAEKQEKKQQKKDNIDPRLPEIDRTFFPDINPDDLVATIDSNNKGVNLYHTATETQLSYDYKDTIEENFDQALKALSSALEYRQAAQGSSQAPMPFG